MTTATVLFFIALACMAVVVGSLLTGIVAMARGREKDHKTSNKMMQMRVLFQGLAIVFLFLSYLAR
jgi:hypothetical protein